MKNIFRIYTLLLVLFFTLFSACSKSAIENAVDSLTPDIETPEENEEEKEEEEEDVRVSFTAEINGDEFVASTLLSQSLTGAAVGIGNAGYTLVITGQYWSQNLKSVEVIILYAYGVDFDELSADTEFNVVSNILGTEVPGAFALYGKDPDADVEDDNFGTEKIEEISLKITAIDKENKLIAGEFNFIAIDEDTDLEYKVTKGVFTNLEYELQ